MNMSHKFMSAAIMLCALLETATADSLLQLSEDPKGKVESPPIKLDANALGENTERTMVPDEVFMLWVQDETFFRPHEDDRVEVKKVLQKDVETIKQENAIPPIRFASGKEDIPESVVNRLRELLESMKHRANVRVHFVGHTDSDALGPGLTAKYGDNYGLSRARAEIAAEFFQRVLDLPPEGVSYDGVGDSKPIASNDTAAGKQKNRRVEIQVWYDKISETAVDKEVLVSAPKLNRIQVCRKEVVCKLSYKQGNARRAKLKNLVSPLRLEEGRADISQGFIRQINEVMDNLRDKNNVVVRFVGHTDNIPLAERPARIYGDHTGYSKARARRAALAVQDALKLRTSQISSTGKGSALPVASNDTDKGRALNRRVEVEFWYDDPFENFKAEPQACPEADAAEVVTLNYDPPTGPIKAIYFKDGKPEIPLGYTRRLEKLLDDVADKSNVRLRFTGYSSNTSMERREAMAYGDDIGLSTSRARRAMQVIKDEMQLSKKQVEFEGRGYVQSKDVAITGFITEDTSRVEVEVVYDQLAVLEENEGLEITRIEREAVPQNPYALNLMRITVDGEPEHDPYKNIQDIQRCTDVALDKASMNFRFDNLKLQPRLNVSAWPNTVRYRDDANTEVADDLVQFRIYSNYPAFIDKAEIRMFDKEQSERDEPLAVIEVGANGLAEWRADYKAFEAPAIELAYVLRVYDKKGHYDETKAQPLWLVDQLEDAGTSAYAEKELLVGYGENHLARQTIPLNGGTVLVNGNNIPDDHSVWLAGHQLPVNDKGEFVGEEIFPTGLHTVEVAVLDQEGNGELFLRDLEFERSDWFYVGIADITFAKDSTNGPAELVTGDTTHFDNDLNIDGRLAFYADGKFGDDWELTASADTQEGPLDDIFSNFTDKSPDALFRRLDPDLYYPTFGDDSTVVEDAPTSGKFFVKLKRHDSFGMWGNFDINYVDNELAHIDRGLYGANGHFETESATASGEKRLVIDGFAAEPGTIAGRDEFRGTGGSLFFLRHQDISIGSERLRIEVRDKDSGLVLGVKNLVPAIDYDLDYIQGRVLLSAPLLSTANDNLLVDTGSFSGNPAFLVSRYEYTPGFDELDDLAVGGQVHYWFNDHIKLGVTSSKQEETNNESTLNGFDFTLRKNSGTWLKAEFANTEGEGAGALNSNDGGFSFDQIDQALGQDISAGASRLEASLNLSDVVEKAQGKATLYTQNREAGFSAPGQLTATEIDQFGGTLNMAVTENIDVNVKIDSKDQQQSLETSSVDVDAAYKLSDKWRLSAGGRLDTREDNSATVTATQTEGDRFDIAFEAAYDSKRDWAAYGFTQFTANTTGTREDNNRFGAGGSYRATERLKLDGELSFGDTGTGAKLGTDYLMSDRTNLYMNYALDNERTDNGVRSRKGNMNTGFRSRYSDSASVFAEERYAHGDVPTGLTHALGVDLAPNDRWNIGATLEAGTLEDQTSGAEIERNAIGIKLGYGFDNVKYAGAVEYRTDDSESVDAGNNIIRTERKTWLIRNSVKYQASPDWRIIGKLNHSNSESSQGEFYDGEFTEAVLGYGYRPVEDDRWNTLLKYTYFFNVPTTDQVTTENTAIEFIQKSHIVSLDTIFDLSQRWSLGGKYAYRLGEVSQDRVNPEFFDSRASLYVLRADWHFVNRWDALVEARLLDLPDAEDQRSGALIGIYRHVGKNLKFGIGYNFTDFSDDLTDLDFDSQGVFINLVGKI